MSVSKPGDIVIKGILISGNEEVRIEFGGVFVEFDMYEDILKSSITGLITITDSVDLIAKMPIIGEETLEVEFSTPNTDFIIKKTFRVYSIETKATDGSKSVYIMNLMTKPAFDSMNTKRSRAYSGFTHDIVKSILGETDLAVDAAAIEDSVTKIKFISNYWTPMKCISYCASRSMDVKAMSPNFIFYEGNKGFQFVSVNSLFDPKIDKDMLESAKRNYSWDASTTRTDLGNGLGSVSDQAAKLTQILDLKVVRQFNYLRNLMLGAYSNRVVEHDILRKTLRDNTYNYWYNFEDNNHLGTKPVHSKYIDFNDVDSEVSSRTIFTHAHSGITEDRSAKIQAARIPLLSQLEFIAFDITVVGRTDVQVGELIWMNIKSAEPIIDESGAAPDKDYTDQRLSGRYLISAIQHRIASNEHQMIMRVTKDSFN
jgi:hypothetical protein